MANMLIAYQNHVDDGALSGGAWSAGLPLSNLASRQPSQVARSVDPAPANTIAILDIGEARTVAFLGLLRHNLTQKGRWRITLSDDVGFASPIHDSGLIDIWPAITPFGIGIWGGFLWGGKLDPLLAGTYGIDGFHVLAGSIRCRYVKIELIDPDNASGYLEAGRLIVAPAWQPSINLQYGWSIEQVDQSRSVKSRGGQTYVDQRPKFRRLSFTLEHLGADEMFGNAYELERLKGKSGDVLVIVDPDDTKHRHRHAVYGLLAETTPIANPHNRRFAKEFVIEELV
jgi:hypothetical protein